MFLSRTQEFEAFKTQINLSAYAADHGYVLDKSTSSRNCAVMRADTDKIIIAKAPDQHWVYFSVYDNADNGSIIDFVQKRQRCSLGHVRKVLRPWLGQGEYNYLTINTHSYARDLEPLARDVARVRAGFAAMDPYACHPYLLQARGLPVSLLASDRFNKRIYRDVRGNVVFPHRNEEGVCGYELRNDQFKGFAPGGEKGLWSSALKESDTALVIAESAITALSYAALFPDQQTRFVSTAGQLSPKQETLLACAITKMLGVAQIILVLDHDKGGQVMAAALEPLCRAAMTSGSVLRVHSPDTPGQDWNDVLRVSVATLERGLPEPH